MYKFQDDMRNVIVVTNRGLCDRPFLEQIELVCQIKPKALILREKDLTEQAYESLAEEVENICSRYEIPCILHTFIDVAKTQGVKNIHLPFAMLKEMSKQEQESFQIVGASIHSVEEAIEAEGLHATYLTAGHIFATDCKQGVPPRGLTFLQEVCDSVSIPVYAIGGIHLKDHQVKTVMEQGAAGACIMSEMMRLSPEKTL